MFKLKKSLVLIAALASIPLCISACNGGSSGSSSPAQQTATLSDGTKLTMPAEPLALNSGESKTFVISATGGAAATILNFSVDEIGAVKSFQSNNQRSGKTQEFVLVIDAKDAPSGSYSTPIYNNGKATGLNLTEVVSASGSTYTLSVTNNSAAAVKFVANQGTFTSNVINAGATVTLQAPMDTIFQLNLANSSWAQTFGSFQQNATYYTLGAAPQPYNATVFENITVGFNSTANNASGSYQTMLANAASTSATYSGGCTADQVGGVGVSCNLSSANGSMAGQTVQLTLAGGTTPPAPTPASPTIMQSSGGTYYFYQPDGATVPVYNSSTTYTPLYPASIGWKAAYPVINYNGTEYIACSQAAAGVNPTTQPWNPWVQFSSTSGTAYCS